MSLRHVRILVFALLCSLISSPAPAKQVRRVVLVVAGNISVRDIAGARLPHIDMLYRSGAAGLVNVRTGRPAKLAEPMERPGMEAGCLSMGAGAMATGGAEVRRAGDARGLMGDVPTTQLYLDRTGIDPGLAQVLHTEIARISRINVSASYHAVPGSLGGALHSAGIRTAVVGSSDMPGEPHREAVAIAMDHSGLVDRGGVASPDLTVADPSAPFGIRTNTEASMSEIDRVLPWHRFTVIDFGDTLRADLYAEYCTDEQAARLRSDAAKRLDRFIGTLSTRLDFSRDVLILVSPSSRAFSEIEDERLTPIIIRGGDLKPGDVLISPSTRRPGVITICDIAPTVLKLLDVPIPPEMVGRPASSLPCPDSTATLLKLNLDASNQGQRQVIMRGASVFQSVLVVLVTAAIVLGAGKLRIASSWAALLPPAIPLAMLCLAAFYSGGVVGAAILLILLMAAVAILFGLICRTPMRAFAWLCAATVASLIVDLLRGAPLISSTIASYSLVEGARYYGIGNELMGTLLGATIIGVGVTLSAGRLRGPWAGLAAAAVFAVVFAVMGMPSLGAEAGGAVSAIPAMAVMLLVRRGWKPSARGIGVIALVAVLGVGAVFALDALRGGGSQSHIGRVVTSMSEGGLLGIAQVAQRKLALNFLLLSTSVWSRLLGLSLAGSWLLYWMGRRTRGDGFLTRDQEAAAAGCSVAVACAFILNDSGVLAAATCAVFIWSMLAISFANPPSKT